MKRAVGYIRLSKEDAASLSLESQAERIRQYCKLRGLELVGIHDDNGISGGVPLAERPGGGAALAALGSGEATEIVAIKHDRLFRSVIDGLTVVEQWRKDGIGLHLVDMGGQSLDTSKAFGWCMFANLLVFSETERRIIGERTTVALQHKNGKMEKTGGCVPYGFEVYMDGPLRDNQPVKRLRRNVAEQETIALMQFMREKEIGFRQIAAKLNRLHVATRNGQPWMPGVIHRILERAASPTIQP